MSLSLIEIIVLLAAAQGVFLTILLFHKYGNLFATRALGILILLYSVILGHLLFSEITSSELYYYTVPMIAGLAFAMIPLHYLYAKYLIHNTSRMQKRDRIHFVPFILWEGFWLIALFTLREHRYLWEYAIGNEITFKPFIVFHWITIALGFFYLGRALIVINRYDRMMKKIFSSVERVKLNWLRYLTYLSLAMVAGFFLENFLRLWDIQLSYQFTFSTILLAVYVYTIGYLGLFKSEVFTASAVANSIQDLVPLDENPQEGSSRGKRYEKSGLSQEQAEQYRNQLLDLMETEQPYQDSDLTLKQLADWLSVSPHNLSEVINTTLIKNFFDFVNEYRVEQVKEDLKDPDKTNLTVLAIAYDAGFNSKSTFYTIFKKATGMTPSEYRREHSDSDKSE